MLQKIIRPAVFGPPIIETKFIALQIDVQTRAQGQSGFAIL
jgi:hypothetical protein